MFTANSFFLILLFKFTYNRYKKAISCCWCNSVRTTQIYAKITNEKVNVDMKILFSRIENRYELPKDDLTE